MLIFPRWLELGVTVLQPVPHWLLIHFMFVPFYIVPETVAPDKIVFVNPGTVKLQEMPIGIPPPPGYVSSGYDYGS